MLFKTMTILVAFILSITSLKAVHVGKVKELAKCLNSKINMSRKLVLWDRGPGPTIPSSQNNEWIPSITLFPSSSQTGQSIPLEQRVTVHLHDEETVSFVAGPEEKTRQPEGSILLGGILSFSIPPEEGGRYRISLNKRAGIDIIDLSSLRLLANALSKQTWIDVINIDSEIIIPSVDFATQYECKTIVKSVEFELEGGKKYLFQISSAIVTPIEVMISRAIR